MRYLVVVEIGCREPDLFFSVSFLIFSLSLSFHHRLVVVVVVVCSARVAGH